METTIVQPGTTPAIYTTGDRHHGDHGRGHGYGFETIDLANYRALTNEIERFGTANLGSAARTNEIVQDTSCKTDQLVLERSGRSDQLVQGTSARSNEIVQAGFGVVHDRLCDTKAGIVGAVNTGFTAEALADCKLSDEIAESKLQTAIGFKDSIIANNVGFSAANVQAAGIGSAAQVLATAFAGQARDQATANYNGLTVQANAISAAATVQVERVRAELALAQQTGFAAQALLATQLDAQARREADQCCCELKEKITAEGVATRALINEVEARRTQNELQRLQTQVAVLTGGVVGGLRAG